MNQSQTICKANTTKRVFSRTTSVSITIKADVGIIWALLTNASEANRWNSTIVSIEGEIKLGQTIKLKSTLDPKRTFKIKVKEMNINQRLTWGDAMGTRIFTLENLGNGYTKFNMTETIGGPLFPLFAKMIPDFNPSFEQFANDLKKEAEIISETK